MYRVWRIKYRAFVLISAVLLTAISARAQQNISGVINLYAHVVDIDTCLNTATIQSTTGFSQGDRVLIIQMKGAQIDISNTATYGTVTSMNGAGQFEIGTISTVPNLATVRFRDKLLNNYDTKDGYVQLVRIPQYTNVTVSDTLRPQLWNPGSGTGGVLILEVSGTLTLNAPIDATGLGFSGGSASSNGSGDSISDYTFDGLAGGGGYKGEGIASNVGIYVALDVAGRGPASNGGGGGDAQKSGGGGGGNYRSGGHGGDQTDAATFGTFANGGLSGIGTPSSAQPMIFMGGGGGGGQQTDNYGTNGGNGGGIVIIRAPVVEANNAYIISNGGSPGSNFGLLDTARDDGAGGGGAGGTILFDVDSVFLKNHTEGNVTFEVNGGNGGSVNAKNGKFAFGPGGGGCGGIALRKTGEWGVFFINDNGGSAGTLVNCTNSLTNNSTYGAAVGDFGADIDTLNTPESFTIYNYPASANVHFFSICEGDSIAISAAGADSYLWTPSDSLKDSTDAKITVGPDTTTVYSVLMTKGNCTFTDTVHVAVQDMPNAGFTGPDSACDGSRVTYYADNRPGINNAWIVVGGVKFNSSQDSVEVNWNSPGFQTITLTASNGPCITSVTKQINVSHQAAPEITGDTSLCFGDSATLSTISNYLTYLWHPNGETTPTITVSQTGTYSVDVTSVEGCSGSSNPLNIIVHQLPQIPLITRNGLLLSSSILAEYYIWSYKGNVIPGDTQQTISPDSDGVYAVTITDSNGCSIASVPYDFVRFGSAKVSVPVLSSGTPGTAVSIPITLDSANGLVESGATNYVGSISLDASMLTPINPIGVIKGTNWIVQISGLTPNTPGTLQSITVIPIDSGYCSAVLIDTFYFPNSNIKVTIDSGTFCLTGQCRPWLTTTDTAFTIKSVSPNPATGWFNIQYHIATEGPVTISLQDCLGRTVKILKDQWSATGGEDETYSVEDISSGVYRIVLQSGSRKLTKILVENK